MPLPSTYSDALPEDHVAALEEAIPRALDHAYEDVATLQLRGARADWADLVVLGELPERYRDRYTLPFGKQFVTALVVATHKMADPRVRGGAFSCVAEELAAHLVITQAEDLLTIERESRGSKERIDFSGAYAFLFEDTDFLMLYDSASTSMDSDQAASSALGLSHLTFDEWFEPFAGHHVHPMCEPGFGGRGRDAL